MLCVCVCLCLCLRNLPGPPPTLTFSQSTTQNQPGVCLSVIFHVQSSADVCILGFCVLSLYAILYFTPAFVLLLKKNEDWFIFGLFAGFLNRFEMIIIIIFYQEEINVFGSVASKRLKIQLHLPTFS